MAASTSTAGSKQVWPVERYARYISSRENISTVLTQSQEQGGDNWQHYSSLNGPNKIQMILISTNHLLIKQGDVILESFSLWGTPNWIKGIVKGDSILFLYRQQTASRKFRIKLATINDKTSLDICQEVVSNLKNLMPMTIMDDTQQPPPPLSSVIEKPLRREESQLGTVSLKERAQEILTKPLSQAYITHLPTDNLSQFIRLCLTDSTFPAFVEAVEKELNGLK